MKKKILSQLLKEYWLPLVITIVWTLYGLLGQPFQSWVSRDSVNSAFVTFFGIGFWFAQWNRVKKQLRVDEGLTDIDSKVRQMLDSLEQKTNDLVGHMTGGESYCFVMANPDGAALFVSGIHPLFNVTATILDEQKLKRNKTIGNHAPKYFGESLVLGTLLPAKLVPWPARFDLGAEEVCHFKINFFARNGTLFQAIQFRKVDGKWLVASKVS